MTTYKSLHALRHIWDGLACHRGCFFRSHMMPSHAQAKHGWTALDALKKQPRCRLLVQVTCRQAMAPQLPVC